LHFSPTTICKCVRWFALPFQGIWAAAWRPSVLDVAYGRRRFKVGGLSRKREKGSPALRNPKDMRGKCVRECVGNKLGCT